MSYHVYYLLDPDTEALLYIGRSHQPTVRLAAFQKRTGVKAKLGISQRHSTFESSCLAEVAAILRHHPPFNKIAASAPGRRGCTGGTISEAHRAAISRANKGKVVSAETRAKTSRALTGKRQSVEAKEKIAAANRGKRQSPETVAKRMASILAKRRV